MTVVNLPYPTSNSVTWTIGSPISMQKMSVLDGIYLRGLFPTDWDIVEIGASCDPYHGINVNVERKIQSSINVMDGIHPFIQPFITNTSTTWNKTECIVVYCMSISDLALIEQVHKEVYDATFHKDFENPTKD